MIGSSKIPLNQRGLKLAAAGGGDAGAGASSSLSLLQSSYELPLIKEALSCHTS